MFTFSRLLLRDRSRILSVCVRTVRTKPGAAATKAAKKPLPVKPPPPLPSADVAMTWNWVPPRQEVDEAKPHVVPVLKGEYFTPEEIETMLTSLGGIEVKTIQLSQIMDTITHFVFVSGRSKRHLQQMAGALVQGLKDRELSKAVSYTGHEGGQDDWLLVDGYNIITHIMLPETRKALDLEEHWSKDEDDRPSAAFSHNPEEYERRFEAQLDKYPVPDDYNAKEVKPEDEPAVVFPSVESLDSSKKTRRRRR